MTIEEHLLVGKTGDPDACEDALVMTDHFVAVLDGATSKAAQGEEGAASPGKRAVERIAAALERMPADVSAGACFRLLDDAVAALYREDGMLEAARADPALRCSAAAVVYSRARSEVWLAGDCQALIGGTHITDWYRGDAILSDVRAMFLESELADGRTVEELRGQDTGREYIREMLARQRRFQNLPGHPYAYSVIDGFLTASGMPFAVHPVPPGSPFLVLASDGYPELKPTLRESEAALRRIVDEDPLCFRLYRSTKGVYAGNLSFDDRAYVRVRLGGE